MPIRSCKLCFVTSPTIGGIEHHLEHDHNVKGDISELWTEENNAE